MDDAAVRQHVRRRIADGRLPCDRIGWVSATATYAADETCAACSIPVSAPQILYKLARAGSPEAHVPQRMLRHLEGGAGRIRPQADAF